MIRKPSFIRVDDSGKELQEKDAHLLDLAVNEDLEAFVLLQGTIKIGIGDTAYQLCKGDGCFINSEVCVLSWKTALPF